MGKKHRLFTTRRWVCIVLIAALIGVCAGASIDAPQESVKELIVLKLYDFINWTIQELKDLTTDMITERSINLQM